MGLCSFCEIVSLQLFHKTCRASSLLQWIESATPVQMARQYVNYIFTCKFTMTEAGIEKEPVYAQPLRTKREQYGDNSEFHYFGSR
jgi:hypothetical protein